MDAAPQAEHNVDPQEIINGIAIRMADEGIPIRAICRTTKLPSDDLRLVLAEACDRGVILGVPNEDWPPNSVRESRHPAIATLASFDDELLNIYLGHVFGATRLEACVLIPLIKRPFVSRENLHQCIEDRRPTANDETDPKMVDVVICKLRKKLVALGLKIDTHWSRGYSMSSEHRKKAAELLLNYANTGG